MARIVSVYWPGSSRSAGNSYWPCALVTTLMASLAPAFLAVTTTPSMAPSASELTLPVMAEPCAQTMPGTATSRKAAPAVKLAMSLDCIVSSIAIGLRPELRGRTDDGHARQSNEYG